MPTIITSGSLSAKAFGNFASSKSVQKTHWWWQVNPNSLGNNTYPTAIALDNSGTILITGGCRNSFNNFSNPTIYNTDPYDRDILDIKCLIGEPNQISNPSSKLRFNGWGSVPSGRSGTTAYRWEEGRDVSYYNSDDSLNICGTARRYNESENASYLTTQGILVQKTITDSSITWSKLIGTGANGTSIAVNNSNGQIYATGENGTGSYLISINTDGTIAWQKYITDSTSAKVYLNKTVVDDNGNIYVSGATSPLNDFEWQTISPSFSAPYVKGAQVRKTFKDSGVSHIMKFNSSGILQWSKKLSITSGVNVCINSMCYDSFNGYLYACGNLSTYDNSGNHNVIGTNVPGIILKINKTDGSIVNSTGLKVTKFGAASELNSYTFPSPNDDNGRKINFMTIDNDKYGNIYVGGTILLSWSNGVKERGYIASFNSNLELRWSNNMDAAGANYGPGFPIIKSIIVPKTKPLFGADNSFAFMADQYYTHISVLFGYLPTNGSSASSDESTHFNNDYSYNSNPNSNYFNTSYLNYWLTAPSSVELISLSGLFNYDSNTPDINSSSLTVENWALERSLGFETYSQYSYGSI